MRAEIPAISAKCLGDMPQFVFGELGEKGLSKVFTAAGLPLRFLERRDGYIPEQAAASFILETSRLLGHEQLGLLLAPFISIRKYGLWGEYILSAPTLGNALSRVLKVMPFHANQDQAGLTTYGEMVRFSYQFALRDPASYPNIAYVTLAALLDIVKHFCGEFWIPHLILIDCPRPIGANNVEDYFGCPVQFDAEELAIIFPIKELNATNNAPEIFTKTTVHDIARERASGPPDNLVELVRGILFQQLIDDEANLDNTARMLDMGTRRLQRALEREGTSFRQLATHVTMERASELLGLPGESVSSVATELGYSSPTNFSRAFKKETGHPPRLFLCK